MATSVHPAAGIAFDEAVQCWYRHCIDMPQPLDGALLAYEPRAVWGCGECHSVMVGVKSGELYSMVAGEVKQIAGVPSTRVLSIHGCCAPGPVHAEGRRRRRQGGEGEAASTVAVVGDDSGTIHVFRDGCFVRSFAPRRERVSIVRLIPTADPVEPICLIAYDGTSDDGELVLATLDGQQLVGQPTPRNIRWMFRERAISGTRGVTPGYQDWLLVSMEGHLASLRFSPDERPPQMNRFSVDRLREAPVYVASDRWFDRVRSLVYGHQGGLRVAVLDAKGVRVERGLLDEGRVHYCRVAQIFNQPHLIACGSGGRVWSRPWDNPEDTRDVSWQPWPPLPSDALFVDVAAPEPAAPHRTEAALVLRNHRVYRVSLYHRDRVKEAINRHAVSRPWTAASEAECYAEVTLSPELEVARILELTRSSAAGQRTLEGIVRRLARHPTPPPRDAVTISVAVLLAASRLGRDSVRATATLLHGVLVTLLRDIPVQLPKAGQKKDRRHLEDWVVFLKKHYLMAGTFSEKQEGLDRHVASNLKRLAPTPDALIYDARLRARGYDVLWQWEEPIRSPVLAAGAADGAGARVVGISQANGRVLRLVFEGDGPPEPPEERRPAAPERRVFGNYSRVLHLPGDGADREWLAVPRSRDGAPERSMLRVPPRGGRGLAEHHQVYAIHALVGGGMLLGLRDLDVPFARWDVDTDSVHPIEAAWGTALHVRSAVQGGERRLWALVGLGATEDGGEALAVGAEDGYLRIGVHRRATRGDAARVEDRFEAAPAAFFLGSSVRSAVLWSGEDRRLLLAGTERGEIFCFEVRDRDRSRLPDLVLKFRDVLLHPVACLFTADLLDGQPQACALDRAGRITTYDLLRHSPHFLGRRTHQYLAAEGGTMAVPLGEGRVLVCGWDGDRQQGRLRLLQFRRRGGGSFALGRHDDVMGPAREAARRFAPNAVPDLLASFPLDDSALRAALVRERLGTRWSAERLRTLRDQALGAYPGERQEMKALLETAVSQLGDEPERVRSLHEVFIKRREASERPAAEDRPAARDAGLQAATVRRLLVVPMVRRWRAAGYTEADLGEWVGRHLQHQERVVRMETLRALSELLLDLLRLRKHGDGSAFTDVFPGSPPVRSAGWLMQALARFLFAHPPVVHGAECDPSTWAATSVLVGLLRLMPDSAFVILDHLSVNRVDALVFGVLKARLTNERDRVVAAKLERYVPWVDRDPTPSEVKAYCRRLRDGGAALQAELEIRPADPDHDYWAAHLPCYQTIGRMIEAKNRAEIKALAGALQAFSLPGRPPWAADLSPDRKSFLEVTGEWIRLAAAKIAGGLSPAEGQNDWQLVEDARRELLPVDASRRTGGPPLFLAPPALGAARAVLGHWADTLHPPLPTRGSTIGAYTLKAPIAGSDYVWVTDGPDGRIVRIAETELSSDTAALVATWNVLRELSSQPGSHLVPMVEVIEDAPRPGLVMGRVAGALDLRQPEAVAHLSTLTTPQRVELAFLCAVDVAGALREIHATQLYHGDVRPENVLWARGREADLFGHAFYLADFDLSGNQARFRGLRSGSRKHDTLAYHELSAKLRRAAASAGIEEFGDMQACDAAALYQTLLWIMFGGADGDPNRHWLEGLPHDLDLQCPPCLDDWFESVRGRWARPERYDWAPRRLLEEATGGNKGIYVAAASGGDAERIRNTLHERLDRRVGGDWVVQDHWQPGNGPIIPQLHTMMSRCRFVVVVLGAHAGTAVPPDQVPPSMAAAFESLTRLPNQPPTYTQYEFLLAQLLEKTVLCFDLEDGPSANPAQQVLRDHVKSRFHCRTIAVPDCDRTVLDAVGAELGRDSQRSSAR